MKNSNWSRTIENHNETHKITEITTTVESVRQHLPPENNKFNLDETIIGYDPFDPNLVDGDEVELDNYEGLNGTFRNPVLEEVIEYLTDPKDELKEHATAYLQHICFKDNTIKERTVSAGAIGPLVILLRHDNPIIQRNACGVLRNLCFGQSSKSSKMEVMKHNGIDALVSLIRLSPFDDIRDIASATLWNMSSCDELKDLILNKSLQTLVNAIIVPYSGWSPELSERRNPQGVFPSFFKNATGVLRNCSSAGMEARQKLRCTDNLIPALIHAVQSTLTSHRDNKSLENCLCLLRNLCYHLPEIKSADSKTFSYIPNSQYGPSQIRLLWQPDLIPCYIAFMRQSTNPSILEAAAGCIQNLTAWAAQLRTEVRRANGLPVLIELLRAMEYESIVRVCAICLRNLASNNLAQHGIHDLVRILPPYISPTETVARVASNSTLTATLAVINTVIQDYELAAKTFAIAGGIERMIGIVVNHVMYSSKVIRYTAHVLRLLWKFNNLHSLYKQMGFIESDFKVDFSLTADFRELSISRLNEHSSTSSNCTLLRPRADLGMGYSAAYDSSTIMKHINRGNHQSNSIDASSVLYATVKRQNGNDDSNSSSNQPINLTEVDSWV